MNRPTEKEIEITENVLDYIIEYYEKNEPQAKQTIAAFHAVRDEIGEDIFE